MNSNPSPSTITRRSFIKRSVVAAVAVSGITIFSGLVNAVEPEKASGNGGGGGNPCYGSDIDREKCCDDHYGPSKNAYRCFSNVNNNTVGYCDANWRNTIDSCGPIEQ
jgi:hypothetical protein